MTVKIASARVANSITGQFDQIWAASRQAQNGLPFFEEVAIGELGESAAATALFRPDEQGRWLVLRKGARLDTWLKFDPGEFLDLASGLESEALGAALSFALSSRAAVRARVPIIGDGVFDVLNVLSLPLATRWGFELVMIVAEPRAQRLNIAEVLTHSCKEGLLALTVWRERPDSAADFRVVGANQAALEILGKEGSPVVGARLSTLLGSHQGQAEMLEILRLCARDRSQRNFHACFDAGGRRRDVQVGISPSDDLFAVTFTDVSEMKAREESFRLLFEANPLPMTICDRETLDFIAVNAAARGAWRSNGKPVANFEDVWPEARPEDLSKLVDKAGAHMLTLTTADGAELQALAYGRNLISDGRDRCLLAFVDVTERRRAEERIERLAHNDPLTGLDNRASYMAKLERALSDGALARGSLGVVVVDLDHFKEVNDTLGHPVGDRVLCEVAARLQARLSPDQTVARLGGDEFAILLPGQPSAQAVAAICAQIIADLSAPYRIECDDIRLGASAGVALAPDHGADPHQLLKHADMALYQVKGSGRGQAGFFNEGLARSVLMRRDLGLALRRAIEFEEFVLYYQPMVRISDGDLRGFEALLRWQRPEVGVTLPGEFIRQAEEMGLITEIGEWVIFKACREASRWPGDIRSRSMSRRRKCAAADFNEASPGACGNRSCALASRTRDH